jgi:hypothetical protein
MMDRTKQREAIRQRCDLALKSKLRTIPAPMMQAALARDLADVQSELFELGQVCQVWDDEMRSRWLDLREDEARLWHAIQNLNGRN